MKRFLPYLVLVLALAAVGYTLKPARNPGEFDVNAFGRLPVLVNGRLKPYDSVARNSLLMIQGKQTVLTPDERSLQPMEWLLDVFFRPALADTYQIFLIDDPDLLALFNLRREDGRNERRFSYNQMLPYFAELDRQAQLADQEDAQLRSRFGSAAIHLRDNVVTYQLLRYSMVPPDQPDYLSQLLNLEQTLPAGITAVRAREAGEDYDEAAADQLLGLSQSFVDMTNYAYLFPVPAAPDADDPTDWKGIGESMIGTIQGQPINASVLVFAGLGQTWNRQQPEQFNELVHRFSEPLAQRFPDTFTRGQVETRFNSSQPFVTGMVLFILAFLAGVTAWLVWPDTFRRIAFYLTAIAWVLTTAGILTRMWLEGRPPVTNLYSSALFVGWGAVGLCLILEMFFRNAIASVAAGLVGFATLVIAHNLSLSGDTLEMMRAVLDSNFWLATHVVTVTIGYSATFLAGFLALIYIVRGVFTKSLDKATADSLNRMVYGIICFATLFSLVGTVLGGIWADQSWGRFWGWDPKENGALIIVLWNALILHARWGGLVRTRGLMSLAIFGNIVTSWSWFGVNMLGVGLHSYGFTNAAFVWLIAFVLSQLAIIGVASLPLDKWRSFHRPAVAS